MTAIDNGVSAPADSDLVARVQKALIDCGPDRAVLIRHFEADLKDLWTEALVCLEQALPHVKGDGSDNARLFAALRHRVLNKGGVLSRSLPVTLGCYVVSRVVEQEVVQKITVKGEGPWNLAGARMPEPRPKP